MMEPGRASLALGNSTSRLVSAFENQARLTSSLALLLAPVGCHSASPTSSKYVEPGASYRKKKRKEYIAANVEPISF